ncbi:hypothetical protein [Desulfosporosinus sp. Sb-LF]|uniref:hypothetical protein n=1 Tax=Desulfosporosinus sp. Sb-LF TaxID=2560027 RepID=UPI00107F0CC6|nr:hypothetical protein [Desulfosporosinus sp. Sb-LF]TGE31711.1 hypothetical protein E4K68_15990 [Desulfosporosinus sp. Sb-LF]
MKYYLTPVKYCKRCVSKGSLAKMTVSEYRGQQRLEELAHLVMDNVGIIDYHLELKISVV